jgi:branched-chain amino acid transport system ATP-binding protein
VTELLRLEGIDAYYGASQALHNVSLSVRSGEVVLLLGRNGAGKTTVMRSIFGLVAVKRGQIIFHGRSITDRPPHQIAQLGIGLVPEDRRMFAKLTVRENLELGHKPPPEEAVGAVWDLERVFALFPTLQELHDRKAGNLSGGQQQMVTVARTLMGNPTLLLLDEPAEGLAPVIVDSLAAQFGLLRTQGLTMMISEQNLTFARSLADRAYVMESGCIRHHGTLAELDADPASWTRFIAF